MRTSLLVLCLLLGFWLGGACTSYNQCSTHYNCPQGMFCYNQRCVSKAPPDQRLPLADAFPSLDAFLPGFESGEASAEQPNACQKDPDCAGPEQPFCREGRCVAGYFDVDFKVGHKLVDPTAPLAACNNRDSCKEWQDCVKGYCRNLLGTKSQAKGKLRDRGFFLADYSYSHIVKKDGASFLRTVLGGVLSDKVQEQLHIDIPLKRFTFGSFVIDGTEITARFVELRVDLHPPREVLLGTSHQGNIKILHAGVELGEKIAGTATLVLQSK